MKKRKFFSYLFLGLLTVGATGMVTSCKDYDDDIDNLQKQIDNAALKSDIESLKTTLSQVETTANAAMPAATANATFATQSDLKTVSDLANTTSTSLANLTAQLASYATKTDLATTNGNVDKAQSAADVAQKAAEAAQKTADEALAAAKAAQSTADNAATKAALEAAAKAAQDAADKAQAAAEAAQKKADAAVTQTQLTDAVSKAIKDAQDAQATINKAATDSIAAVKATADAAATKAQMKQALDRVSSLERTSVTAAQLKLKLDSVGTLIDAIDGDEGSIKQLRAEIDNYSASISELYQAVTSVELVESFSYDGEGAQGSTLSAGNPIAFDLFHGVVGKTSTFGDDESYRQADSLIHYKEGQNINSVRYIIVRVSPTNANLATIPVENFKLIDSQGNDLSDYLDVQTPVRYDRLITYTRASGNNTGLWKIPVTVKDDVTKEAYNKAVVDPSNEDNDKLYALAIRNTNGDSTRYVVSTYDLATSYNDYKPATTLHYVVNSLAETQIHNRIIRNGRNDLKTQSQDDASYENLNGKKDPKEYAWNTSADEGVDVPDIAFNFETNEEITPDSKKPGVLDFDDIRFYDSPLQVQVGKPFAIKSIGDGVPRQNSKGKWVVTGNDKIDYYYVTLDKAGAVESNPSEWNAWLSYNYTGLYKMTKADEPLNITINKNGDIDPEGDQIGFRLYAVNLDGTLVDPDGKAFYVNVGEIQKQEFSSDIVADKAAATDTIAVGEKTFSFNTNLAYNLSSRVDYNVTDYNLNNYNYGWHVTNTASEQKNIFPNGKPTITVKYLDEDKNELTASDFSGNSLYYVSGKDDLSKIKYVVFTINSIANMVDGSTVNLDIFGYRNANNTWSVVNGSTITAKLTKVLPTAFPKTIGFRSRQQVKAENDIFTHIDDTKEYTGLFVLYLTPENGWSTDNISENGYSFLGNIFYGIDGLTGSATDEDTFNDASDALSISFADAKKENNKDVANVVYKGSEQDANGAYYKLNVNETPAGYINTKDWHKVTMTYNYGKLSLTKDADGNYTTKPVKRTKDDMKALFACWANSEGFKVSSYVWTGTNQADKPSLQWAYEPAGTVTKGYNIIKLNNKYNDTYFGGTLDKLINNKRLEVVKESDATGDLAKYKATLTTTVNGNVVTNQYFTPTFYDGGGFGFTQTSTQMTAAPGADHDETLTFYVKDCYGHYNKVELPVTIKAPKTAAKKH